MSDPTTAPTHDELARLVVGETQAALTGMAETFQNYAHDPQHWPHLAASFAFFAHKLGEHAGEMSSALAAYAAAHPEVEPDEDGVGVMFLAPAQHARFWDQSDGTVEDYAKQVTAEYGRPELAESAVDLTPLLGEFGLTGEELDAVVVFQHFTGSLVADRPHAARVLIGGLDVTEHEHAIDGILAHFGITPVQPKYWPPVPARVGTSFLSLPGGVYDAFGRPLDGPDEEELAARAGRGLQ
jgi:hypothetical protein